MKLIRITRNQIFNFCKKIKEVTQQPVLIEKDLSELTPHQQWLTKAKGHERPFTGNYWFTQDVGNYHCVNCNQHLFKSDQKFMTSSGMASFWNHITNNLSIVEEEEKYIPDTTNINRLQYLEAKENKRCECSNCKAHLGLVFMDGPHPTLLRFSINSGSIEFVEKQHFEDPNVIKKRRSQESDQKRKQNLQNFKNSLLVFDKEKYEKAVQKTKADSNN